MTAAVIALALVVAGLGAAAVVLGLKLAGAKDDARKADGRAADAEARTLEVLGRERLEVERAGKAEVQVKDLLSKVATVEGERNELAREVAALKVKLVATLPVGEEGAAAVNDGFSTPLLSDSARDGLEKP